jgi:Protein of unknown function (DUF2568)
LKSANVVLRFLLELCALAALAYWGATAKVQLAGRIALAIGIPLIAAVVWALVVAPRAPVDLGSGARLAVELLVFAAAIAALASRPNRVGGDPGSRLCHQSFAHSDLASVRSGMSDLPTQQRSLHRHRERLLADTSVNTLAQEIGMAVVAGVLLDHVNEQLPKRDWFARAVASDEAEVGLTSELLGKGNLVTPCGPRLIDNSLIGHGTVEVTIWLGLGLIAIRYVLPREPLPEPLTFDLGQMSHEAEQ